MLACSVFLVMSLSSVCQVLFAMRWVVKKKSYSRAMITCRESVYPPAHTACTNTYSKWKDCLGYKVRQGRYGKTAFKFIERVFEGDDRIQVSPYQSPACFMGGDHRRIPRHVIYSRVVSMWFLPSPLTQQRGNIFVLHFMSPNLLRIVFLWCFGCSSAVQTEA